MPLPFKRVGSARQVDWPSRDALLAEEVRIAAAELKKKSDRPIRVTRHAIGRHIDKLDLLTNSKMAKKIPSTVQALTEVVEERVEFVIRRLRWAAELFRQESVVPSFSGLGQRSGTSWEIWHAPEVKAEIEALLSSLRNRDPNTEAEAA
jgi:hypothetical protein